MAPATGISSYSERVPMMMPVQAGPFANDAIISWFRGEFAAANAIIDALCSHLSQLENERCDQYKSVFEAIHQRRLNWIPILQMQKYFSIADVTLELQKVVEEKSRLKGVDRIEEIDVSEKVIEENLEISISIEESNGNGESEIVDIDSVRDDSQNSEITDSGKSIFSISIYMHIFSYLNLFPLFLMVYQYM